MFTGIVETVGTVTHVESTPAQGRIAIASPAIAAELRHGESVAVNGVCLTVDQVDGEVWTADTMRVTREHTTLGALSVGTRVNLERAMPADGRLGGHWVQGHVDGMATVVARDSQAEWDDVTVEVPEALRRYVVAKGSVTFNGVSLTVAALTDNRATVSLIPTTLRDTTLGDLGVGDSINIEVDILAKYVESMLGQPS